MRFAKAFCVCSCVLGVLGASAFGQDIYMSPDGEEALGNHVITVAPGSSLQLSAWANPPPGTPDLGAYTVEVSCEAYGGISGTVLYDAGSQRVDNTRADWVFAGAAPAPTVYTGGEICTVPSFFGIPVAYTSFPNGHPVTPNTPGYMQDWTMTVSAEACGTFTLDFASTAGPLGGSLFSDGTGMGSWGNPVIMQSLTIIVGPENDDCAAAQTALNGPNAFDTSCATTDGPAGCNAQNDTWFTHTATCSGALDATTSGLAGGVVGIYSGGCPPTDLAQLDCAADPSIAVNTGDSVLIRVGTSDGSTRAGSLNITCTSPPEACCFPGRSCQDLIAEQCRLEDGAPFGKGTACADADACVLDESWAACPPGPGWVNSCPAGQDLFPSRATIGLDLDLDCVADTTLNLGGDVLIRRGAGAAGQIETEIVAMTLTGASMTLRAGAGGGMGGILPPSLGIITEQAADPTLADSFFDVFFEADFDGRLIYNHTRHRVGAVIPCVAPTEPYSLAEAECIPLFDSSDPGTGMHIANIVTGVHTPFPAPIPTVTDWGMVIMTLLLATGTIVVAARRADAGVA